MNIERRITAHKELLENLRDDRRAKITQAFYGE